VTAENLIEQSQKKD
jgi:multiple RNA-binding domain-containing protein 1